MAHFNLEDYETVDSRIAEFWRRYPNGRLSTSIYEIYRLDSGAPIQYIVKASCYADKNDTLPLATGFAEEVVGASPVNKTSALENGETSALGRCLRNANIGSNASREEMQKVQRKENESAPADDWDSFPEKKQEKIHGKLPADGVVMRDPQAPATEKQINFLVKKASNLGITSDILPSFACWVLGISEMRRLTKQEASTLIGMDETEWEVKVGLFKVAPRTEYPLPTDDYDAPF